MISRCRPRCTHDHVWRSYVVHYLRPQCCLALRFSAVQRSTSELSSLTLRFSLVQSMSVSNRQAWRCQPPGASSCRHPQLQPVTARRSKTVTTAIEADEERLTSNSEGGWSFSAACEPRAALVSVPLEDWLTTEVVDESSIGTVTAGVTLCFASAPLIIASGRVVSVPIVSTKVHCWYKLSPAIKKTVSPQCSQQLVPHHNSTSLLPRCPLWASALHAKLHMTASCCRLCTMGEAGTLPHPRRTHWGVTVGRLSARSRGSAIQASHSVE